MTKVYFQHETVFSYIKDGQNIGIASSYEEAVKLADKGMTGSEYIHPINVPFVSIGDQKIYAQHESWFDYSRDGERKLAPTLEEAKLLTDSQYQLSHLDDAGTFLTIDRPFVVINDEKIYAQHEYVNPTNSQEMVSDNLFIEV